mgnify:CR=1 FL=1
MIDSIHSHIVDENISFNQYKLLEVSFLCKGKHEYPTALRTGVDIKSRPLMAFRNGEETQTLYPQYQFSGGSPILRCTALCLQDGSPYWPDENRDICDRDKYRIYACNTKVDNDLGLLYVSFSGIGLLRGKPIYPTALATGYTTQDNPVNAFWGGNNSVQLPVNWVRNDDQIGWAWETTTILNLDGTAIDNNATKLLSTYYDIVDLQIPGRIDIDAAFGVKMSPPVEHKIKARIDLYLVPATKMTAEILSVPYHVQKWTDCGMAGTLENGTIIGDQSGCRGYLVGNIGVVTTKFKGSTVKPNTVFNTWGYSTPNYDEYISKVYTSLIDCKVRVLFTSANGIKYFLMTKVTGQGKESTNE